MKKNFLKKLEKYFAESEKGCKFAVLDSAIASQRTAYQGGTFIFMDPVTGLSMEYLHQPLEVEKLISILESKNLVVEDKDFARNFLENVSYFRFSTYLQPFEEENKKTFKPQSSFYTAVKLYNFDKELRNLLFPCIQEIEVSLRTKIINYISLKYGAFWFLDSSLAVDKHKYTENIYALEKGLQHTKTDFIDTHYQKYDRESYPPIWKMMELTTFGQLTKIYCNFSDKQLKKKIARSYGLPQYQILESWMKSLNILRNSCAHHERIWNRTMPIMPQLSVSLTRPWISEKPKINNKLYAVLCCLIYWLKAIDPKHPIVEDFKRLLVRYPMIDPFAMGFPKNWKEQCIFDE